jgi:hypothetical protein
MTNAATQENRTFDPLAEGDYLMALKSVEDRKSKKGDDMVTTVFEVIDGEDQGRLIYDNFLVTCAANPEVPEYAQNRVSRFLQAVGVDNGFEGIGSDYGQLSEYIGKPFVANVTFSKPYKNSQGQLTVGNRIKSFKTK